MESETNPRTAGAADLALLVSVAANVTPDFSATVASLPALRAVVTISPPGDTASSSRAVLTAGRALDVAHLAVDALRAARAAYHGLGTIHERSANRSRG
jgi:hypothetical protein